MKYIDVDIHVQMYVQWDYIHVGTGGSRALQMYDNVNSSQIKNSKNTA
jgi:hypothetical protein